MKVILRPYQEKLVTQVIHHLTNGGDALIEQPTGSGKTLEIVCISAAVLRDKFSHIVITAPQQQIEEGFLSTENKTIEFCTGVGSTSSTLEIASDLILQLRDDGRYGVVSNLKRYLNDKIGGAIVCTHQSLTYEKPENILPLSLVGYLLVVDEAHHASADALGELIELWKMRGGNLLYATATPFRKDGRVVLRQDMKLFRRLIAQHMEEGFAPAELNNEIIGVSVPDAVSALEFTGDEITETHRALVIDAIYEAWIRDGKPKAIIRVPSGNSQEFISDLMQKFAGVRILNGAGTDIKDKGRFINGLTNPSEKTYVTSKYDLVVGVQRVLEGTDWSVCSHVYCVGVPGSLTVVVQLIGRALRKKDDTHPIKNRAKVSFFVLGANEKSLRNLEIKHSRHALLTCVFMANYHLGGEWIINKQIIEGIKSGLKNGEISPSLAGELETETNNDLVSLEDRANISLLIMGAIASAEESGKETPTVEEIIEYIKSNNEFNFDDDTINQVITENLATRNDKVGERVRDNFGSLNLKPGIDKEKRKFFDKIVKDYRNETLDKSIITIGTKNQLHKMTGGNITEFCDRLIKIAYLSYDEASSVVAQENIHSQADWIEYCKSGRKPDSIPYHPDRAYENCGWIDLSTFLQSNQMRSYYHKSYDEFVLLVQQAVKRGELKPTHESYQKWSASDKRPKDIPGNPERMYKDNGFTSWQDVFGVKPYGKQKEFMSFDDAKIFVQKLNLKSQKEWLNWKRAGNRPEELPCDPQVTYKKQWISWGDFLGTNTISSRDIASKFPSYEEAKTIVSGKFFGKGDYQKNKPENLPYQPNRTYKDKWVGWEDFLDPLTKQTKRAAKCGVNGCDRSVESNGLCGAHYRRSRFGYDMNQPIQSRHKQNAVCIMDNCNKTPIAKNLCRAHYNQMRKNCDL